jgi:ADP-ribose pyrophosphatase YjhB (NUDIX family)
MPRPPHRSAAAPRTLPLLRPLTTVDIAIFAVAENRLQVLLVQRDTAPGEPYPGRWALPGGFIDVGRDETLEACARRKLSEKTGVAAPYLEQLGSWGNRTRDPRGWSATHAWFALIRADETDGLTRGGNAGDVRWAPIDGNGVQDPLAFDHAAILAAALERLRGKVEYTSLPAFLLPPEFTLSDLQRAYEVILGRPLEKSAFRTRVLATDLVTAVPRFRAGPNRPARLYRLRSATRPVYFQRTFKPV